MPDTTCRKCGCPLAKFLLCAECRQPVQQICTYCGIQTAMIFHNDCFYPIELFQTNGFRNNKIRLDEFLGAKKQDFSGRKNVNNFYDSFTA